MAETTKEEIITHTARYSCALELTPRIVYFQELIEIYSLPNSVLNKRERTPILLFRFDCFCFCIITRGSVYGVTKPFRSHPRLEVAKLLSLPSV